MKRFERVLQQVNEEEKRSFVVECSCGAFVTRPDADLTLEKCIQESDGIMYREKCLRHGAEKRS